MLKKRQSTRAAHIKKILCLAGILTQDLPCVKPMRYQLSYLGSFEVQ